MQLKIKRSQREAGVLSKNVVFCLDARVAFTADEQASLHRYKLWNQCIYNSEASKRLLERSAAQQDGSFAGGLKSLANAALAGLSLNITIASLASGQRVECRSMDELLGAEEAIMAACQNLRGYIDTAASFDGREVLFDFSTGEPQVLAHAVSPSPQLIAPANAPTSPAAPALFSGGAPEQLSYDAPPEPYVASEYGYEVVDESTYKPSSFNGWDTRPLMVVGAVFAAIVVVLALLH